MRDLEYGCIDAGTENCPCKLAETGNCVYCSRLAGNDYCDCNWKGVCVFNEFHQNGGKTRGIREEFEASIIRKKKYKDNLYVIVLDTGTGFAIKASQAGSFVSLKKPGCSDWYNMPVSVMKSDIKEGYIYVAVKELSVKSKKIIEEPDRLVVRGIFRNGLIGIKNLQIGKGRIAVISKGIGFAAAAHFIEYCPDCDVYIDTDKICREFARDYMPENFRGKTKYINLNGEKELLMEKMTEYKGVVVAASEYFADYFKKKLNDGDTVLVTLNNSNICCGEGICGACCNKYGIKMCKCSDCI